MKKALVIKSEFGGRSIGQIERIGEADEINKVNGNLYNKMEKVEVPVELEDIPSNQLKGVLVPVQAEKWIKDGQADVSVDPLDETWTYVPAIAEHWEVQNGDAFVAYDKKKRISEKFDALSIAVAAEMKQVYDTTNPDSAVANYLTWMSMKNNPPKYLGKGLVARFEIVGLTIGDALDTEQKVTDYSTALIDLADDYAIWREQQILIYASEKATIEAE